MTPARLRDTAYDVGGLRVFTREGGPEGASGVPIVLVHGAVISGRYMLPTAVRLATRHRVYVPDLPGFGKSEDPPRPLRVTELADVLTCWMDAAGLARAHFLGNSLGCQVIAEVAARSPARAVSLVLVGPTVDREARSRTRQLWRLAKDAFLERPTLIPLHLRDVLQAGWRFAVSTLDIALAHRIEETLEAIPHPVLIVCGSRDPLAPREWCAWLAARTPNARLELIEGPHALNYSRPEALVDRVEAFLGTAVIDVR